MSEWFRLGGSSSVFSAYERRCALTGIDCPTCGNTWAIYGIAYPTVDCGRLPAELATQLDPVEPEAYRPLEAAVAKALGDARPLAPGAEFGALVSGVERVPPKVFRDGSALFLGEQAAADPAIAALGLRLARFVARTARSGKAFVLHEVEAWPLAARSPRALRGWKRRAKPPCARCGYQKTPPYDASRPAPLLRSTLEGHHIVRLDHAPGTQFVSGVLRSALLKYGYAPAVTFAPVEVVDE
ncbi:MAG: double-CXXCG motif protein [Deltaproteobacteria bacterium]|nr:double-CXXCG motif protein [Kofleriaceae bacterium]